MPPNHDPWLAVLLKLPWTKLVGHVLEVLYHKHYHKVFIAIPTFLLGELDIEVSNKDWVYAIRELEDCRRYAICLSHDFWRDVAPNDKP